MRTVGEGLGAVRMRMRGGGGGAEARAGFNNSLVISPIQCLNVSNTIFKEKTVMFAN